MKLILKKGTIALLVLSIIFTSLSISGLTTKAAVNNDLLVNGNFEATVTEDNVIPGYVFTPGVGYTNGTATVGADSLGVRSGKVLTLNVGSAAGETHRFRFYKPINVAPNTDYVWEFYMAATGGAQHAFGVVAGNTVNDYKNTALPVTVTKLSGGTLTLTTNTFNEGVLANTDGSADPDWTIFGSDSSWKHMRVEFNSGNNTSVSLTYVARSAGRSIKFDDWVLYEAAKTNSLVNGNFNAETSGYLQSGTTTFEVIDEPNNTNNNILHVVGGVNGGGYYQIVNVETYTDYVWSFRMKDIGNTGTTRLNVVPTNSWSSMIKSVSASGSQAKAVLNADATASIATLDKTWQTFTVKFNSGANTAVKLYHNMWASNREIYMDDWILYKELSVGEIVNGDFEIGNFGIENNNASTLEVISDPDNIGNNILHAMGAGGYYRTLNVKPDTDYVWTFRMKDIGNVGTTRISVVPADSWGSMITSVTENSSQAYAVLNADATISLATYDKTWQTFKIIFNSGSNSTVRLYHNLWADNREVYMDDWKTYELTVLNNPGFESATVTEGYTVENITATSETTEVYSGSKSLKLDSTGTWENSRLTQAIKVVPNTDYAWTFWYKSYTPGKPSFVGVRSADSSKVLPSFIKSTGTILNNPTFAAERPASGILTNWHETLVTDGWNKYVVTFNSGDNNEVLLTVNMHASGRGGYIDDWSISKWSATPGDSSNDGTVDSVDLSMIKEYLVTGIAKYHNSGMDANENKVVDVVDLIRIKKLLANLNKLDGYSLVWSDDFGTTILDESKWGLNTFMLKSDDLEIRFDESAVKVDNGSVTMGSGRVNENTFFKSGDLNTMNTMNFKYGYLEMRAKVPYGAPGHASFWMKSAKIDNPDCMGEIDIFEHFCSKANDYIQTGIHKWYDNGDHLLNSAVGGYNIGGEAYAEDWHNYGMLWTPEKIEFSVDGKVYHTISIAGNQKFNVYDNGKWTANTTTSDSDAFHDYYYIILCNHIMTADNTGGTVNIADANTQFPINYEVDYVRLYQKPGEGGIKILNK